MCSPLVRRVDTRTVLLVCLNFLIAGYPVDGTTDSTNGVEAVGTRVTHANVVPFLGQCIVLLVPVAYLGDEATCITQNLDDRQH